MPQRCCALLGLALCLLFAGSSSLTAQTDQTPRPITSLPKAPGDTSSTPAAVPSAAPAAAPAAANPGVHPITSLPKRPGQVTPAAAATPAVSAMPTVAAPTVAAPSAAPDSTVVVAPTPAAAQPVAPQPVAVTTPVVTQDAPLHVMLPVEPEPVRQTRRPIRPFSAIAVDVKGGFAGFGFDIATPLAQHFNLRLGASFFTYAGDYNVDGVDFAGSVNFRSGNLSVDYYPFHNGFRISPGVVYNGNNLSAILSVPAGQNFDLGDGTYQSDPTGVNPVHGTGSFNFGRHVAPSLTIGYGNMIPRSGGHFSMPFEIGFEYISPPSINFALKGTACDPNGLGCGDIATDPGAQSDLKDELSDINSDITLLRFYPIISLGVAWKF